MKKFVTSKKIDYHSAPYGFIATIPKGTEATVATNLPPIKGKTQYWAKDWKEMTAKAKSWKEGYGFLLEHDEIEMVEE